MDTGYKCTLDMTANSVYDIEEVANWCHGEYGLQGHDWNYAEQSPGMWIFVFATTRDMVRFGLTWNKSTMKFRPRLP